MSIKKPARYSNKLQFILLGFLLLLGFYFRFTNLESKVFWVDEIATAIRVSGYTISEVTNNLQQQDILNFNDLLIYQKVTDNKNFFDSWQTLTKSPEHAPLYFVLNRFWMQLWGSSIATMRSLSAVLGLLVLPALYWLCQELFDRPFVSQMAIALMSVSPFYVAYAQEARPYSLWTIAILLMSASFLKAIRVNNWQSWIIYSLCVIFSFYTSLFSIYVAFFQGIYILFSPLKRKLLIIKKYCLYSAISLLAFVPWILIIINNLERLQENTSWMRGNFNLVEIIAVFIGTILLTFGDLPISQDSNPAQTAIVLIIIVIVFLAITVSYRYWKNKPAKFGILLSISSGVLLWYKYVYFDLVSIIGGLVALIILSVSGYSLYYLISNTNRDRWLFILCLIISLPLPLLIVDIINQGQGSTAPRYLIPLQLGIQIAVAYTFTKKIVLEPKNSFWKYLVIGFLILGIFSCIRNLNLSPFYQKGRNINNPAIANMIDRNDSALLLVEPDNAMDSLSLAYSLSNRTKYKIINADEDILKYSDRFLSIFLLKPSSLILSSLENNPQIGIKRVYNSHLFSADEIPLDLWQLTINKY